MTTVEVTTGSGTVYTIETDASAGGALMAGGGYGGRHGRALGRDRLESDVYPLDGWKANVTRIADLDSFSSEARQMKRHVFGGALVTELDAQGRVLLPQQLVEHAGLGRDVVVAGVHDHIEIWDRTQWDVQRSAIEGSVSDVAERLADKRG